MADTFTLTLDTTLSRKAFQRLREQAPIAIARALNRSADSGKTIMVREISRDLGTKVSDVRNQVAVLVAHPHRLMVQVSATGARIPIMDFKAKGGKGRGVTYKIGAQRKTLPHAFIATMKSGHTGVFERSVGKFMRFQKPTWKKKRQAIHEKFGPSLPHVFRKFMPIGLARMKEQLIKNLRSEFRFAMSKRAS